MIATAGDLGLDESQLAVLRQAWKDVGDPSIET